MSDTTIAARLEQVPIATLDDAAGSGLFIEAEKAGSPLAEVVTLDAHGYTKADFARLRSFYDEGKVVELMAAIGSFNYFNRLNDLLEMEPTQPASVRTTRDRRHRSSRAGIVGLRPHVKAHDAERESQLSIQTARPPI